MACGHGMLGWKAVGRLGLRGVRHEGKVPLGQAQGPGEGFAQARASGSWRWGCGTPHLQRKTRSCRILS